MASDKTSVVILGASGDLAKRKLIPALFELYRKGRLPADTRSSASPAPITPTTPSANTSRRRPATSPASTTPPPTGAPSSSACTTSTAASRRKRT